MNGTTYCYPRACTDPIPNPNAGTCTAYLSTCAFNGTSCATSAPCSSYLLTSSVACNSTTDGAGNACGYTQGGISC